LPLRLSGALWFIYGVWLAEQTNGRTGMTEPTVRVSDETLAELLANAKRFHLVDYRYRDTALALAELQERRAAIAAPVSPLAKRREEFVYHLIQRICEIPDRNSPDDEPDALICNEAELRNAVANAFEYVDDSIWRELPALPVDATQN